MKKRMIYNIVTLLLAGALAGCANKEQPETVSMGTDHAKEDISEDIFVETIEETTEDAVDIWQTNEPSDALPIDLYGDYKETGGEIAFVSNGEVMDESYNEAIYKGIQKYALAAGASFSYYIVEEDTKEGRQKVIESAVSNQAKIIICAGCDFEEAIGVMQEAYPDVAFLMIDGVPVDEKGNAVTIEDNVHCISFHEEESGYLAGYMTVLEGYRNLGFIGGKEDPPVIRYGYGYLQGIEDAVQDNEIEDVTVNYWYADSYEPDSKIYEKALEWYAGDTEVIFACGGLLFESVLEAAEQENGLLIGVDRDQSDISDRFLTSAIKDISNAVIVALDDFYAAGTQWPEELAGQETLYGIQDNCTGIPVYNTKWRFSNVKMEDFYELNKKIKAGDIIISDEIDVQPKVSYTVKFDKSGEQ